MKHSPPVRERSGFTLIELLVVIAIIAILAAILFPVFAQAREKARGVACLSNCKQMGTAMAMYTQDFDETLPNLVEFNRVTNPLDPNDTPGGSTGPGRRAMWQLLIYPYNKSWDIYNCPSDAYKKTTAVDRYYYLSYGYNGGYLSNISNAPTADGTNQSWPGITLASILRPAQIIAIADGAGKDPGVTYYVEGSVVEPPDALPSLQTWYSGGSGSVGWGTDGGSLCGGPYKATGCNAIRHQDGSNYVFCDGHAKYLKKGAAAGGTTYDPTKPTSNTCVKDYSQYLWDPKWENGVEHNYDGTQHCP